MYYRFPIGFSGEFSLQILLILLITFLGTVQIPAAWRVANRAHARKQAIDRQKSKVGLKLVMDWVFFFLEESTQLCVHGCIQYVRSDCIFCKQFEIFVCLMQVSCVLVMVSERNSLGVLFAFAM